MQPRGEAWRPRSSASPGHGRQARALGYRIGGINFLGEEAPERSSLACWARAVGDVRDRCPTVCPVCAATGRWVGLSPSVTPDAGGALPRRRLTLYLQKNITDRPRPVLRSLDKVVRVSTTIAVPGCHVDLAAALLVALGHSVMPGSRNRELPPFIATLSHTEHLSACRQRRSIPANRNGRLR